MNFNNIPQEMKALNQWTCYRSYYDKTEGKQKKIIISPVNGKFAKCNAVDTWTDFESAKNYCQKIVITGLRLR